MAQCISTAHVRYALLLNGILKFCTFVCILYAIIFKISKSKKVRSTSQPHCDIRHIRKVPGGVSDRHFHHKLQLGVAHTQSKLEFGAVQDGVSSQLDVFLEFF